MAQTDRQTLAVQGKSQSGSLMVPIWGVESQSESTVRSATGFWAKVDGGWGAGRVGQNQTESNQRHDSDSRIRSQADSDSGPVILIRWSDSESTLREKWGQSSPNPEVTTKNLLKTFLYLYKIINYIINLNILGRLGSLGMILESFWS